MAQSLEQARAASDMLSALYVTLMNEIEDLNHMVGYLPIVVRLDDIAQGIQQANALVDQSRASYVTEQCQSAQASAAETLKFALAYAEKHRDGAS